MEDDLAERIGCTRVFIHDFVNEEMVGFYAWWLQPDGSPIVHGVRRRMVDFVNDEETSLMVIAEELKQWWRDNHAAPDQG